MKTIEERANEYADTKVIPYDEPMYNAWRQAIMNDYLAGAREQKGIDKAIFEKWYCKKICYRRKECQIPLNICFRIGEIEKQMEEEQ